MYIYACVCTVIKVELFMQA